MAKQTIGPKEAQLAALRQANAARLERAPVSRAKLVHMAAVVPARKKPGKNSTTKRRK